jgi:hypothetical protein
MVPLKAVAPVRIRSGLQKLLASLLVQVTGLLAAVKSGYLLAHRRVASVRAPQYSLARMHYDERCLSSG